MAKIDISGLDEAAILAGLFNLSKPQGLGFMEYSPEPMSVAEARLILDATPDKKFSYLGGKVMKIEFEGKLFETADYNYDIGQGAAESVIHALRNGQEPPVYNANPAELIKQGRRVQFRQEGNAPIAAALKANLDDLIKAGEEGRNKSFSDDIEASRKKDDGQDKLPPK